MEEVIESIKPQQPMKMCCILYLVSLEACLIYKTLPLRYVLRDGAVCLAVVVMTNDPEKKLY